MTNLNFTELPTAWQGFLQACNSCRNCDLYRERNQVVVYRGSLEAPLMIIGEGPGRQEDIEGLPFVGRSGRLLDDALLAQGFREKDYHICNIVKCRPPNNRAPLPEEAQACRRLLNAQFGLVKPQVVLLAGASAYKYFTGREDAISKVRGQWIEAGPYHILPTFHPAYILRNMSKRDELWDDLTSVRTMLEKLGFMDPQPENSHEGNA